MVERVNSSESVARQVLSKLQSKIENPDVVFVHKDTIPFVIPDEEEDRHAHNSTVLAYNHLGGATIAITEAFKEVTDDHKPALLTNYFEITQDEIVFLASITAGKSPFAEAKLHMLKKECAPLPGYQNDDPFVEPLKPSPYVEQYLLKQVDRMKILVR